MAKMIPGTIERCDPRRHGEYLVYDWLSSEDIPGVCFYSLPQKNHKHKMIGEVDFLYISEAGMLCIEVKGGQEIYREGRQWFSVNKNGVHNPINDPFIQSRTCMYALGDYLKDTYGHHSVEASFQLGYCVVFPECVANCKGNDIVTEVMFDNRYELSDFKTFISRSLTYWHTLEKEKHFGQASTLLTSKQVKQMVDLLQADFGSIPSMKLEIQYVEDQMLSLSDEQLDVVLDIHENKRVLVSGAAGTGKSLIALAKVRKSLAEHKRVLFVCYNRNMAQYARLNLDHSEELTVKTFHALVGEYLSDDIYQKSLAEICKLFCESDVVPEKYDVLVVDEAQDLMRECVWDVLDAFLKKGLEKGEWVAFTDPNQSIFTDTVDYQNGLQFIKELYSPVLLSLTKNWRNTAQIGRRTSRLTSVPPARHMKVDGPKVVVRKNLLSSNGIMRQLRQDVHSLLMGGISAKDIVILSPRTKEHSSVASIQEMCNLELVAPNNLKDRKSGQLNFYTVQSYKGLESSVVLYIDIPGFKSVANKQINYVAMSRARALLYMYINDDIDEEYEDAMIEGLDALE